MVYKKIFIVLFIALFTAMLGAGVIAPTMPLYAETMGATGIWLGLIWAGFSVSRAIFMPVAGKLSDRRGRKQFIVTGLSIYTVSSIGYVWATSISQLIWIRFLHGIGSAMVIPIAAAVIGDLAPKGHEGRLMGNFGVALFLGFGAGPLLGGVLMDAVSMESVFYSMGVLSLIALILVSLFLPEKKEDAEKKRTISRFSTMWKLKQFRGLLVFRFSNAVCRATLLSFLPIFASGMQISSSRIGLLLSINILLTGILQKFFGVIADKIDRRTLIITGNVITAMALLLTPLAKEFIHLIYLGLFMGVGSGLAFPAAGAVATELGRDHGMGNMMGFFNLAMSIGMILGPIVSGFIMDQYGKDVVFLFASVIGLLGSAQSFYWLSKGRLETT